MSSHLAVLASLALAIFLSPETLVLGLIIAGDKKVPRLAALAYALGGMLGIAFATGIGLWIAHASGTETHTAPHHGWPSFLVRMAIAAALISIGARRAINALQKSPIPDVAKPEHQPGALRTAVTRRFPGLDPNADLPVPRRVGRAGLAGFAMCGLHPKVFPIAIAAGHQIVQITDRPLRTLGIVLFAVIAVIPALVPLVIDMVKPGATVGIKEAYERIMKVHGRWITALLLLGAGSFVAYDAWRTFPGH
jgi:threonine/homoserine/homoserine lactone efflux protein